MRACAALGAALLGLVAAAAAFAACTSGLPSPDAPPAGPHEPASTAAATAEAPPATGTASAPAPPKAMTAADCRELVTDITNDPPDGGVVMSNATAVDAGTSDRLAPIVAAMRERRDAFRCCFDLWGKSHPGDDGRAVIEVDLQPDGTLDGARVDPARSSVTAPEVTSCMTDVAKAIHFPPSPSKRVTHYAHLFEFKARP